MSLHATSPESVPSETSRIAPAVFPKGSLADRLSGGQQQRVAIVRALIREPLLILADSQEK